MKHSGNDKAQSNEGATHPMFASYIASTDYKTWLTILSLFIFTHVTNHLE